jgi:ADP-heptose:LPS heptosyltransferase
VLLGAGASDERRAAEILAKCKSPYLKSAIGVLSIRQTAALLETCSIFIGNDSGPLHLAAAARVPSIQIFGHAETEDNWTKIRFAPWNVSFRQVEPTACGVRSTGINDVSVDAVTCAMRELLQDVDLSERAHTQRVLPMPRRA